MDIHEEREIRKRKVGEGREREKEGESGSKT